MSDVCSPGPPTYVQMCLRGEFPYVCDGDTINMYIVNGEAVVIGKWQKAK